MLSAVILAGGESTRMGSPKAVLPDADGQPFVTRIVRVLHDAGLTDVVVVTGSHHTAIEDALGRARLLPDVRVLRNPDPGRGQLSSLWVGLDACPAADGLLMTLVDVPMIAVESVVHVVNAWRTSRAPIVRPIVNGRRGHPVIFDRAVFEELRQAPLDHGARVVIRAHWNDSVDVPLDDPGCLVDIDTPADYQRLGPH